MLWIRGVAYNSNRLEWPLTSVTPPNLSGGEVKGCLMGRGSLKWGAGTFVDIGRCRVSGWIINVIALIATVLVVSSEPWLIESCSNKLNLIKIWFKSNKQIYVLKWQKKSNAGLWHKCKNKTSLCSYTLEWRTCMNNAHELHVCVQVCRIGL